MPMAQTLRGVMLAVSLTACSGAPSDPEAVVAPERPAPAGDEPHATLVPPARPADPPPTAPAVAAAGCEPRVTEVLFVPQGSAFDVTILGDGFCMGAAPPSARFGELPLTNIVVASSGKSMAGRVAHMPPAGATLEVHTPPGLPVVTSYEVP
jgi:hypothetical protein